MWTTSISESAELTQWFLYTNHYSEVSSHFANSGNIACGYGGDQISDRGLAVVASYASCASPQLLCTIMSSYISLSLVLLFVRFYFY